MSVSEITVPTEVLTKERALEQLLRQMDSVLVAFSGGVDSSYLAAVAYEVLGQRMLAVTAVSPAYPERELEDAKAVARQAGFRHHIIQTHEVDNPKYAANGPDRCYFCKVELYDRLEPVAREEALVWIADGYTADDIGDFRPGKRATKERGVRSPLFEVGLEKDEIRLLSRIRGLPTWDKPAMACLSSRIPYGTPVTFDALRRIEQAESILRSLGFRQFRVRHHDSLARIEVQEEEMTRFLEDGLRAEVVEGLKVLGYTYVSLDLAGYRRGSLNEALRRKPQ